MIDQHVHSVYSIDSNEPMENYIKNTDSKIITFTEHYDLGDPFNDYKDVTFDIIGQKEKMIALESIYNVQMLQGIEIGYSRKHKDRIKEVLKHSFDVVLLSVHHNDDYDYMMDIKKKTKFELVEEYYTLIEEALDYGYDADVLTHMDFGLRLRGISLEELSTFEPQIKRILQKLIDQDMSFEVNAKGFTTYNQKEVYDYYLSLYKEIGGINIVVNSDAHTCDYYEYNFKEIYAFLIDKGFNRVCYYINRKRKDFQI